MAIMNTLMAIDKIISSIMSFLHNEMFKEKQNLTNLTQGGPIKSLLSVCPSVCQSISFAFFSGMGH